MVKGPRSFWGDSSWWVSLQGLSRKGLQGTLHWSKFILTIRMPPMYYAPLRCPLISIVSLSCRNDFTRLLEGIWIHRKGTAALHGVAVSSLLYKSSLGGCLAAGSCEGPSLLLLLCQQEALPSMQGGSALLPLAFRKGQGEIILFTCDGDLSREFPMQIYVSVCGHADECIFIKNVTITIRTVLYSVHHRSWTSFHRSKNASVALFLVVTEHIQVILKYL